MMPGPAADPLACILGSRPGQNARPAGAEHSPRLRD
jgi:hypothetical protein